MSSPAKTKISGYDADPRSDPLPIDMGPTVEGFKIGINVGEAGSSHSAAFIIEGVARSTTRGHRVLDEPWISRVAEHPAIR
jgi:hypothetical protein